MRTINVRLLPDGTGRVRYHWFIRDDAGPITTPSAQVQTAIGRVTLGGVKGRIACMPKLDSVLPHLAGAEIQLVPHTDDPRGATCPECLATEEAKTMLQHYAESVDVAAHVG
jgi:hypothetical protein